jgi:glutamine amidotransferase
MGNLASVLNAFKAIGESAHIVSTPDEIKKYERVILPGVGAFGDAMEHLKEYAMVDAIKEYAKSGKPLLGICLGMQLLFEESEEFGNTKGLGLIDGNVKKFDQSQMKQNLKIPHMGWNKIVTRDSKLFDGLNNPYLYFVHSYHVRTDDKNVIGTTEYGSEFVSAVNSDNIYGFQPHPEKSHENGLKILQNFMKL